MVGPRGESHVRPSAERRMKLTSIRETCDDVVGTRAVQTAPFRILLRNKIKVIPNIYCAFYIIEGAILRWNQIGHPSIHSHDTDS